MPKSSEGLSDEINKKSDSLREVPEGLSVIVVDERSKRYGRLAKEVSIWIHACKNDFTDWDSNYCANTQIFLCRLEVGLR